MSDLQDLLKKIKAGPVSTQSYVYYNKEDGKIHKISSTNVLQEGLEIFEIDNEEVKPILSGQRRTEEFTITYDISSKQIRLKEVSYDDNQKTADTMTYQLPVIKNTFDGHFSVTSVFEGIDICIWDITKSGYHRKSIIMQLKIQILELDLIELKVLTVNIIALMIRLMIYIIIPPS